MEYEVTESDISIMREWLTKVTYLPHETEDVVLAAFITAAKGSIERAKTVFDNHFGRRITYPELLTDLNPCSKEQQRFMDNYIVTPLPRRTSEGSIVIVVMLTDTDPKEFSSVLMNRQFCIIIRYLMLIAYASKDGVTTPKALAYKKQPWNGKIELVNIAKGLCLEHLRTLTPTMLASSVDLILKSCPVRLRGCHVTNMPRFAEYIWTLVKTLVSDKISSRLKLHTNVEDLLNVFSKDILPSDLGGDEESLAEIYGKFRKELESSQELFLDFERKVKKCDSLRPRKDEDIAVGTFRKLVLD